MGLADLLDMSIGKLAALLAVFSSACSESKQTTVTYHQDIKPIFDAKCVTCHTAGGIAPFPLDNYASAAERAAPIARAVVARRMPPWPPNPECREYEGDRSLDTAQIEAIQRWVALDAPEGDPSRPGAPIPVSRPTLSRVDLRLELPEPYTPMPPAGARDDYRCFVIPWPAEYTQRMFVTGFRGVPGDVEIVHHMLAFLAGPDQVAQFQALDAAEAGSGYTCFGGPRAEDQGIIAGWAPGTLGADLPAGIGLPIEPGSALILQVHYNGRGGPDRSALELKLDTAVDRPGHVYALVDPQWTERNMPIPAGARDVVHSYTADPTLGLGEIELFSALLHMHLLGTSGTLSVQRADGSQTCLLQINRWDFNWQDSFFFTKPEIVRRGDRLSIECHWDNSAENQPIVNGMRRPPADVNWGDGTDDEMCVGFFLTAPLP